ncbi:hypothetical protein [Arthrobacter wenxiniae]|jgi:hypothetical protein|uniref:Uncharacterized protein n=1 Tax=Arthrobacter wenxiniae TaxID=2713570 RepID=A0A7Y7IEQ7_9MICC|nr:hypothetical protein [Arthrobacter wenxiniae]NVM94131.1 hypothetical protein [Arthrobacter wenxiniae]
MTLVLQWVALAVCVACTAWRLPTAIHGRNRSLFWAFLMVAVSVALSIPVIYLPVDGVLGGVNLANVVLRLSLFAVFFLLAAKVAAAYNAPAARAFIRGPVGLAVLIACSAGILVTYAMSDLRGSSPGLSGFTDEPAVVAYMWIGRLYPAYAAAALVPATARAALSRRPAIDRAAAFFMCLGFTCVCVTLVVQMSSNDDSTLMGALSFGAVLSVAAGLVLVWVSCFRGTMKE